MNTEEIWTADANEVLAFGSALVQGDYFATPDEVIDYFTKPWKWSQLRASWSRAGRPGPGDEQWLQFCDQFDEVADHANNDDVDG